MAAENRTEQETLSAQAELFRLADRDYGLSLNVLSRETGVSLSALKSYNASNIFARAKMPLWVFVRLCRVVPDELTSLCLSDAGKHVGSNEEGEGDLDELAVETAGFVAEKLVAEADGVVTPMERRKLKDRARRVCATARRVAA